MNRKKGGMVAVKRPKTALVGRDAKTGRFLTLERTRKHPRDLIFERMPTAGLGDAKSGAKNNVSAAIGALKRKAKVRPTASEFTAMAERIKELEARLAYFRTRGEESSPAEVAQRRIAGESPIRVFREYRGLTQRRLAEAVGIGKPYLSELEAGKKPESVEVLARIADVLSVQIGDLV